MVYWFHGDVNCSSIHVKIKTKFQNRADLSAKLESKASIIVATVSSNTNTVQVIVGSICEATLPILRAISFLYAHHSYFYILLGQSRASPTEMLLCVSLCHGLNININDSQNKHTNHEQPSSSMATRKILSVLFILLPDSQFLYSWSHWTDLSWLQWWELMNVSDSATFHLSMLSAHRVLDQCAACTCVVDVCILCDTLWNEVKLCSVPF